MYLCYSMNLDTFLTCMSGTDSCTLGGGIGRGWGGRVGIGGGGRGRGRGRGGEGEGGGGMGRGEGRGGRTSSYTLSNLICNAW